jgi:hypothetical protein
MKSKINIKNNCFDKTIKVDDYLVIGSNGSNKIEIMSNLEPMEIATLLMPFLHELDLILNDNKVF